MESAAAELDLFSPLQALVGEGKLTASGLVLDDPDLSYDAYEAIGRFLGKLGDVTKFALGDWMIFGEKVFGDKVYQAALATGRTEGTCMDYLRVAAKVARPRRRADLSWWHHRIVAPLSPPEQRAWLGRAAAEGWSGGKLEQEIRGGSRGAPKLALVPPSPSVLTRDEAGTAAKILAEAGYQETKVAGKLRAAANGAALVEQPPPRLTCPKCGTEFDG